MSHRCQHLIASLIQDKENRLCSKRYHFQDLVSASSTTSAMVGTGAGSSAQPGPRSTSQKRQSRGPRDFAGHYVFPYDAEDIKAHKWFRGVPWDCLHELRPPHVPELHAVDDTRYFDEEDEISDWSESEASEFEQQHVGAGGNGGAEPGAITGGSILLARRPQRTSPRNIPEGGVAIPSKPRSPQEKGEEARRALRGLHRTVQKWAMAAIATPYDSTRLLDLDAQIEGLPGLALVERNLLRQFIRAFGRKDRKRPRDRLLRDRNARGVVMEVRKRTAFLGYTWRRMRPPVGLDDVSFGDGAEYGLSAVRCSAETYQHPKPTQDVVVQGEWLGAGLDGGDTNGHSNGLFRGGRGDDVAAVRALYRGRMSLR